MYTGRSDIIKISTKVCRHIVGALEGKMEETEKFSSQCTLQTASLDRCSSTHNNGCRQKRCTTLNCYDALALQNDDGHCRQLNDAIVTPCTTMPMVTK